MVTNQKVAVITGSSGGIGLETALMLARNGFTTYATMRTPEKDAPIKTAVVKESHLHIKVIQLDVSDDSSVKNAINQITSEVGRIDVLVNNAGYALGGALEDLSFVRFLVIFVSILLCKFKIILCIVLFVKLSFMNFEYVVSA